MANRIPELISHKVYDTKKKKNKKQKPNQTSTFKFKEELPRVLKKIILV